MSSLIADNASDVASSCNIFREILSLKSARFFSRIGNCLCVFATAIPNNNPEKASTIAIHHLGSFFLPAIFEFVMYSLVSISLFNIDNNPIADEVSDWKNESLPTI